MADPSLNPSAPERFVSERRARPRAPFRQNRRARERVTILGQPMDLVKPEEVLHHIQQAVRQGAKTLIANHNLHSLYLMQKRPELGAFYDKADLVEVDSTPLLAFSRALGLHSRGFHRCTYLDWRDHFWSVANRQGWRVLSVGGAPGVGDEAARRLKARYPDADIAIHHGFFDARPGSSENAAVLDRITAFQPHILFVGMGMPRQELWIAENFERLPDCVILSVGAAFDYEAGVQSAAPRWMGRAGIEWAYRLLHDPKRLFVRYCVEPWTLLPLALRDIRQTGRRNR
ncbi:N-acetylglucosaminyldiphosphoundecaprenol N-acetyl-beta-D-mannosaminyltransferase [Brevundimonas vesicularis]|uniref:N-acetylglucosaminyldiphosphoundecaprenol N-acetyl-beta-D-mannosaminyltransferase n=1 Tax=Brevundimonas vesicularis TaxID=41276 RepID=A0A7W9L630_BREVE|nr:WecB/TagA/CpsF family glycosyltransferase [Brevundimonas vesicularis]MBB5772001.1 N-acetylglucosaminyldiphosphoundecaprenol N-acetyl-beta-D-mannosaminyltransferase [Brevundimonas vesicularis]